MVLWRNKYNYPRIITGETLLMSTHNIWFYGEISIIIPELSPNTPPLTSPLFSNDNLVPGYFSFVFTIKLSYFHKYSMSRKRGVGACVKISLQPGQSSRCCSPFFAVHTTTLRFRLTTSMRILNFCACNMYRRY